MKDKFSKLLTNKTFYLILSIILGIVTWLIVLGINNPISTRTVEVPIEFLHENAPATLDLKDTTVTYPSTATVTLSGRKDTLSNVNASEVRVTCDLENITTAGETTVEVAKPECDRIGVEVTDYYPKSITFTYDRTAKKNLDVRVEYDTSLLKTGYEFISVTSSLSSIPVAGMASLLDTCDYVRVDLSDSIEKGTLDSSKNAAFLVKYISVTGENITHNFDEERVTVEIKVGKRVNVTYSLTGEPDEGCYLGSHSASVSSVVLQGNPELLRDISSIDLGKIDISGASENVTKTFLLADYLPAGVTAYEVQQVTVIAEISDLVTNTYTVGVTSMTIPGLNNSEYVYDFEPGQCTVQIRGKRSDMESFQIASAVPTIDLTGKTVGVYNVPLTFGSLDTSKYTVIGEYIFTVSITKRVVVTPTPVPTATPTPEPTAAPSPTPEPTEEPTPVVTEEPPVNTEEPEATGEAGG